MPVLEEFSLMGKVAVCAGDGDAATPYLAAVLAEAGARVIVVDRQQWVLEKAKGMVESAGQEAKVMLCNTTSQEAVDAVIEEVAGTWERVDILVNVFRSDHGKPLEDIEEAEYQDVMDRNFKPVYLFCRSVGKRMIFQGKGRIVNITTNMAERGLSNSTIYCASQGAVLQLSRALALEWGRRNIRVNVIGTGWFSTEELEPEEAQKELLVRYIPLRRKGHPRDIAPLLVYLASDACDYTTGQPIYIDGGLMAHP